MNIWEKPMTAAQTPDDYPLAVPGTYEFTVTGITGKEYPGKPGGLGRCAWLNVRMAVDGKDATGRDIEVTVFENLFNDPKVEWKLCEFAKAIGIYHEGITALEILNKGEGQIGSAAFKIDEYNGTRRNVVAKYIRQESKPSKKQDVEDLPF